MDGKLSEAIAWPIYIIGMVLAFVVVMMIFDPDTTLCSVHENVMGYPMNEECSQ